MRVDYTPELFAVLGAVCTVAAAFVLLVCR